MRNLIIVLIIVGVFILGSVSSDIYISAVTDEMVSAIEGIETEEDVTRAIEKWNSLSSVAELIIDHNEIDALNEHLWAMEIEISCDYDEFLESKKSATEMFKHIKERNVLAINNIF